MEFSKYILNGQIPHYDITTFYSVIKKEGVKNICL